MKPGFLIAVLVPFLFGVMASFFLVIGLRGVITKKPFLTSAHWLLALVLLGISPAMFQALMLPRIAVGSEMVGAIRWLSPAILIVVVIFLCLTLRGYIAFGITEISFREGLLHSLRKLNLPYEGTLSAVKLPTLGADLQVAVQSWIGAGQLKMKQRIFSTKLREIACGMNEYYRSGAVSEVNLTCCVFYTIIGVFLLAVGGVFLFGVSTLF